MSKKKSAESEPEELSSQTNPDQAQAERTEQNEPPNEADKFDGVSTLELVKNLDELDADIKAKREERAMIAGEVQRRLKKKP